MNTNLKLKINALYNRIVTGPFCVSSDIMSTMLDVDRRFYDLATYGDEMNLKEVSKALKVISSKLKVISVYAQKYFEEAEYHELSDICTEVRELINSLKKETV